MAVELLKCSLDAQVLAHAVVVAQHGLVVAQVELVVVLGEFAVADGLVLVHDAADLHHAPLLHALLVTLELYDLHLSVYIRKWLEGLRNVTYRHWSSCTGCSLRLGRLGPRRRWSYQRTEAGCPCRRTGGVLCGLASRLLLALVPFLNFNLN